MMTFDSKSFSQLAEVDEIGHRLNIYRISGTHKHLYTSLVLPPTSSGKEGADYEEFFARLGWIIAIGFPQIRRSMEAVNIAQAATEEPTSDSASIEYLVEAQIDGIRPDGAKITIQAKIGAPICKEDGLWTCPLSLVPLYSRLANAVGVDSLHCLGLAMSLLLYLLNNFRENGGRLLNDDGTDISLDAYAFGFALNKGYLPSQNPEM